MGFPIRFRKIGVSLLFTLISTTTLLAQTVIKRELPDTQWIHVTFYDFRSNKSNPEFECAHLSGTYKNMAADTLPLDKIPLKGSKPYLNEYFKYWYTPWDSARGGKGDKTMPFYRTARVVGNPAEFNSEVVFDSSGVVNHDTAFINKVIHDSLLFRLVNRDRGIYRFEDTTFFPLDNRGFGREGRSHNYSFTMALHTEFTYKPGLMFTFKGDDDVWTYVNRKLAIDLGGIHNSVTGTIDSIALKNMNLTIGKKYPLDFYYAERHTDNSKIMIETNLFQPELVLNISAEPDIMVEAETIVTLTSDVRDQDSVAYPDLSKKTKWNVVYSNAHKQSDFVSDSGASVQFKTRLPFDTILVEGSINVDGAGVLKDTIKIITLPGPDCKISIEPKIVTDSSPLELRRYFNQIDTIYFFDSTVTRDAYAVVRDCKGAFKRMASTDLTKWSAVDNIIKIKGEDGKKYHGILERYSITSRGTTLAIAKEDPDTLIPDSVAVVIRDYYPVKIRLVKKGDSPVTGYLTQILIYTEDSQDYEVYALLSTAVDKEDEPSSWIKLPVDWDLSSPLDSGISPPEPKFSDKWTFNPIKPGTGNLELVNPEDKRTEKLNIPVTVLLTPPYKASIKIITPIEELIAGHTIKAEVIIENGDGRIPDQYCFGNGNPEDGKVIYQDLLPKGGDKRLDPKMTVDGVTEILNTENGTTYKHNQCFMNGVDTVDFVLYYAPYPDDSLHQITVILRDNLKASTEKFRLLADTLDSLVLTHDVDGKNPITDTIRLAKNSSKAVYAHGYDQYGNYRGPEENSIWNTSGKLPQTNPDNNKGKIHTIFHSNPVDPISGDLCASVYISGSDKTVSSCANVYMYGDDASIMKAVTRDINGNGYLDRIDVTFSKNIKIPENSNGNFSIASGMVRFEVERVVALEGDSVYALYLKENRGINNTAQTDWQPFLSMNGIDGTADIDKKLVDDGAAPVVWTVTKKMHTKSRVDDIVTIVLSEKIEGFNTENSPPMVFWIYFQSSSGTMTKVDLFSDAKFVEYDNQKTIKIKVNKNVDINNNNWVNIRDENNYIKDTHNNFPDSMNQKVRVKVEPVDPTLQIGPNPFSPSSNIKPGKIELRHDQDALINVVRHGGVVIEITLPLPDDGSKVYVSLKIYDVAGNLVNFSGRTDIIEDLKKQNIDITEMKASQFTLDFLWPGHNKKGMKLAPGIYKAVVIIDYANNSYHDTRLIKMVGVGK